MVEKLVLLQFKIKHEKRATTGLSREDVDRLMDTNGTNVKIATALLDITCPEWRFLFWQGYSPEAILELFDEILVQLMS